MAFLNETGLEQVWGKIKTKVSSIENTISDINKAKVDKVSGKGLSTNDYTTDEKNKLAGIATGATKVIVDSSLSNTSTNAIQNKTVANMKTNIDDELSNKPSKTGDGASGTWGINVTGSATKLTTARSINGTSFDGTGNITTSCWGTARNITIVSSDGSGAGTAVSVNGSANFALKLPATIKADLTGKATSAGTAENAYKASKLSINNSASLADCLQYIQTTDQTSGNDLPSSSWWHVLKMNHGVGDTYCKRLLAFDFFSHKIKTNYAQDDGTLRSWHSVLDSESGVARAHYGTIEGGGGYILVTINSGEPWMLSFTLRLYQSYTATDIQISGYNYGSNYWYHPQAIILGSTTSNAQTIYFGYTEAYKLWVAVPAEEYTGADVFDATNGYTQINDLTETFTITRVSSLPGATQTTLTCYRPWYRDETIDNAATANKLATARTLTIGNASKTFDGSGNVSWNLAEIGAVPKIEGIGYGSYTVYRALGNIYKGGEAVSYYRIAIPQATPWGMFMMKLAIREKHNSGFAGEIIIYANHSSHQEWNTFYATCIGNLSTNIKVYGSDKKYFYISGDFSYEGLSIELMTVGDSASTINLSNIVIDTVDSLPSTHQTATMLYSLHSGNYTDYTVKKDGTGASGTWSISISGSAASLTTSRTIQTNLGSTSSASFDGTANIAPGVTGTLAVGNGGTGSTSKSGARSNLGITSGTSLPSASGYASGDIFILY